MARQRFIWPDLWTDPQVANLSPEGMLLFIGCFSNADDDGRLLGDPGYLKGTIFPYQKLTVAAVRKVRDQVIKACPTLVLYEVRNVEYLAFAKWSEYQKPKYPKPSKLPPPISAKRRKPSRLSRKSSGNDSPKTEKRFREASGNDSVTGLGREVLSSKDSSDRSKTTKRRRRSRASGLNGNEALLEKLLAWVGTHADNGTRTVLESIALELPEAALARTLEGIEGKRPRNRAKYAVGVLQREVWAKELRVDAEAFIGKRAGDVGEVDLERLLAANVPDEDRRVELTELWADARREALA